MKKYLAMILVILCFTRTSAAGAETETNFLAHGEIKAIISEEVDEESQAYGFETIYQAMEVLVKDGEYKNKILRVDHIIDKTLPVNIEVTEGDQVILYMEKDSEGELIGAHILEIAREKYLYGLVFAFFLVLLIFGGKKGLKSILTLVFTIYCLFKIFLPYALKGADPLWLAIGICTLVTTVTFFIISGLNKKTFAAIAGTVFGLILAGALSLAVGHLTKLTGLGNEEAQMLMFVPLEVEYDFQGLLFASIIIGALGAIMDVGMSIASAMHEIWQNNRSISRSKLIYSGLNVGRDIMGTMSNTLILAYVGSSIYLIMLFMAYDISFMEIINRDMIASEVVRSLAGSIGLVFSIPFTAVAYAWMTIPAKAKRKRTQRKERYHEPRNKGFFEQK